MSQDEIAIRRLIDRWQQATAGGDAAELRPLMHEDVVFLVAGQPAMRGRDACVAMFETVMAQFRISSASEVQEIEVSGDLAYCWARLRVTVTPTTGGGSIVRQGSTLTVFRRGADGGWVMFRDANLLTIVDASQR
ncbi:MAG: SgcJ/EcaC family oxidoreductase [Vicinamibacterales bacterium]